MFRSGGMPLKVAWDKIQSSQWNFQATLTSSTQDNHQAQLANRVDFSPETGEITFRGEETRIKKYNETTRTHDPLPGPYQGVVELKRISRGSVYGEWTGSAFAEQQTKLSILFTEP
jgi:hypothetical protein